ncbi:MAG: SpoIID/LytB domain-containing protein [Bacillota bacterium]
MAKRVITVFLALLLLAGGWVILPPQSAYAAEFDGIIKVRISPSGQTPDIRVIPHGQYYIAEAPVVQLLDTEYKVHMSGSSVQLLYGETVMYTGPKITIVRATGNGDANFIVFPYSPTHNTRTNYYGNIEFSVNDGLCAVNHVYVEDYVLGVFPYEMNSDYPIEALKAQAVCARNFGVKKAMAGPSATWHLGDTASSQVYKGVPGVDSSGALTSTYNAMRAIVNATDRQVMKYNGSVFEAYYSAWNGGETLNARGWTGIASSEFGYTVVKADAYDDTYCKNRFWKNTAVNTDLHSPTGGDDNQKIQDMLVEKQFGTGSGRYVVSTAGIKGQAPDGVPEVTVVFENLYCDVLFDAEAEPKRVIFTDTDLKRALDISSSYSAFRIQDNTDGTTTLSNVRYGHGVGMSQRGAQQMAGEGKTYTEILDFYYNGITFSTLGVSPPTLPDMSSTPAPTAVSASYNSVKVSWTAVPGAAGYSVYRAESAGGPYSRVVSTAASSYTCTGLKTGAPYYFKVKAYVTSGGATLYGPLSEAASATPLPNTPANFKAASAGYNAIKLTWDAVTGASGYRVYRAASADGQYSRIVTAASNSYTNTGLTTGTAYYYKVMAYTMVDGAPVYGSLTAAVSAKPVPATPANLKASSQSYNSIKLTWTAVPGASGYSVYRATKGQPYALIARSVAANSFTNGSLITGTAYYYKVMAYTVAGTSRVYGSLTAAVSATPVPALPQNVAAKRASSTSIRASWSAVAGASGYDVYRAASSAGSYALLKTTTATAYTNTGLRTGKYYYYKVRAYRMVGKTKVTGAFSPAVYAKP